MEYHKELASGIAGAKGNVREMLEEFKVSTVEQKTLIFEVFDRVSRLQNLVVSEVSWLYTVSFFFNVFPNGEWSPPTSILR